MSLLTSLFGSGVSRNDRHLRSMMDHVFALFGERPADVAQRTGVSLQALLRANPHLDADTRLVAGEPLSLPANEEQAEEPHVLLAFNSIHKHTDADGNVTYTDTPTATPGTLEALRADGSRQSGAQASDEKAPEFINARDLIKAAQKHGGKLNDYMQEIDYLRHHNPIKLDAALKELQQANPELWIELQKHPQFQPLAKSFSAAKAGGRYLEAGVSLATSGPGAAAQKFGEGAVKDLMKRDRHSSAAEVLGGKTTTLPEPAKPYYSNTKLGEWRKAEDANLAKAGKEVAKDLAGSADGLRAAKATAGVRVGGTVLDGLMAAAQPETGSSMAVKQLTEKLKNLVRVGAINADEEAQTIQNLIAAGKYDEAKTAMNAAADKFIFNKQ